MSDSLNTTGNKFYETVNFDRGSDAKGLLLPTESGRIDLGSSSKKFDNVYANNFIGSGNSGGGQITRGTWTPVFLWSREQGRYVSIPRQPVTEIIEARWEKVGRSVWCVCYFSALLVPRLSYTIYTALGGLPFKIHQRTPNMLSSRSPFNGNVVRIFDYNSTSYQLRDVPKVYVSLKDLTRSTVSWNPTNGWMFNLSGYLKRYYFAEFRYRTEN